MKIEISNNYRDQKNDILGWIRNFDQEGESINDGRRNLIKVFEWQGKEINIKSFKVPNPVNTVVYRFFRKSKAERSFIFANFLISRGIGTPAPVAFAENTSGLRFLDSYYLSENLDYDLTFRELVTIPDYPDHEEILRAFTRFTFKLHENGIEFLDHSPGNTLIQVDEGDYKFFLVDLNRMVFKKLTFTERMMNFSRLTPKKEMVEIMANEYARLIDNSEMKVFQQMWFFTSQFQKKIMWKHRWKKKLGLK